MPGIIINGTEGRLEGRLHKNTQMSKPPVALLLHPHPQGGGTMNNKIVYLMFRILKKHGFSVLRFNFRGVGYSQGKFGDGIGELCDASVALDWLMKQHEESKVVWVAGFSFGAWVAMHLLMRRPEIINFITVAPPVGKYDFNFLSPCPASGLIIQGEDDEIVDKNKVDAFHTKISAYRNISVDYQTIEGADHFFKEKLEQFSQTFEEYVCNQRKKDIEKFNNYKVGRRRRKSRKGNGEA